MQPDTNQTDSAALYKNQNDFILKLSYESDYVT